MKKASIDLYHKTFDEVLAADGFVRRKLCYWRIDFSGYWYFVIWLSPYSAGDFDLYFDFGGLMNIDMDNLQLKSEYVSLYPSFRQLFYRPTGSFKLWWIPNDYPAALSIYKNDVSPIINRIHSLFDLYVLDEKLSDNRYMTLSKGKKWIDVLLFLGKYREAQDVFEKIRQWINYLRNDLADSEQYDKEKLQYYNGLSPKIKKEVQHFIDSYQASLDSIPERWKQLDLLQSKADVLGELLQMPKRGMKIDEIKLRLESNCKSLKECFSEEEISLMNRI